jgi:IMP dehydrogenase
MKQIPLKLTFDDVLLEPRKSPVTRSGAELKTRLTKKIQLDIPVLAAAMDTVSELEMAIALGKLGGMAILHRSCSVEKQVEWVKRAKKAGVKVGAATGAADSERAKALAAAGADVIVVDTAHAHNMYAIEGVKKIRRAIPKIQLIVGNIATAEAARDLAPYADALKVGIGPGSICTTRVVAGIGVPQLSAIMDVVAIAAKKNIPVIADGGIKYSGDVVKALAAGASSVMLGSMLAGTDEAPGKLIKKHGQKFKSYRGMGSLAVMEQNKSADRYFQKSAKKIIPEGVEALTPYKGPVAAIIDQITGGLQSGMGYIGARTIAEMPKQARFVQITAAGLKESHPHSISISKKAPNY